MLSSDINKLILPARFKRNMHSVQYAYGTRLETAIMQNGSEPRVQVIFNQNSLNELSSFELIRAK